MLTSPSSKLPSSGDYTNKNVFELLIRSPYWFWDSVVLWQTLAPAFAQVLAVSLDAYFQLIIMLLLLVVGMAVLSYLRPFRSALLQAMQVT